MTIYKITYSKIFRRANIYNYGCNFNCTWCSYKLKNGGKPKKFLGIDQIKRILSELDIERIHFLGGEPTIYSELAEIVNFAKNELGVYTKIGHSNGSRPLPEGIDAASISIKTISEKIHIEHAGASNAPVLRNFAEAYERGITLDASSVLIPGLIDCDEIERIARFIADINPDIPYHIVGYVPVPNSPWRKPTPEEVKKAENIAKRHLKNVTSSCLTLKDFLNLRQNIQYRSVRVA